VFSHQQFPQQNYPRPARSLPLISTDENSSEMKTLDISTNSNRDDTLISSSDIPVSTSDLLDHAVSMAICSRGLTLQEEG